MIISYVVLSFCRYKRTVLYNRSRTYTYLEMQMLNGAIYTTWCNRPSLLASYSLDRMKLEILWDGQLVTWLLNTFVAW